MNTQFQNQIFDIVLTKYPKKSDAIDALCQLMNWGKDSVYRRLRGDTVLSPDELAVIAKHYGISLDAILYKESTNVICSFNAFTQQVKEFGDYMQYYLNDMDLISRLPSGYIWYAASDIPVFSYMYIPEIISFKLYTWGRTTWDFEYLKKRKFSFDLVTPNVIKMSQQVLDYYNTVPATELWSINIVDNTLSQIEHHVYSGFFEDNQDALLLCDKMIEWANHMKSMAAYGKKFNLGQKPIDNHSILTVYNNEMVNTNNTVLIMSDLGKVVYSAIENPNFIKSSDQKLCNHFESWYKNVMSKSNIISLSAEKERDAFFMKVQRKIDNTKKRIAAHLDDDI
jgi:hypothetical protein